MLMFLYIQALSKVPTCPQCQTVQSSDQYMKLVKYDSGNQYQSGLVQFDFWAFGSKVNEGTVKLQYFILPHLFAGNGKDQDGEFKSIAYTIPPCNKNESPTIHFTNYYINGTIKHQYVQYIDNRDYKGQLTGFWHGQQQTRTNDQLHNEWIPLDLFYVSNTIQPAP